MQAQQNIDCHDECHDFVCTPICLYVWYMCVCVCVFVAERINCLLAQAAVIKYKNIHQKSTTPTVKVMEVRMNTPSTNTNKTHIHTYMQIYINMSSA